MTLKWQQISLIAGTVVVSAGCITVLAGLASKYTEIFTLQPRKVEALEQNYKALAKGQDDLSHRIDGVVNEIAGVSQRLEVYAKRAEEAQRSSETLLQKISVEVGLTREQVFKQDASIAALREKAINTAVAVDAMREEVGKR